MAEGRQREPGDAEERFELWRRRLGLALAPVAFVAAWFLTSAAHRLAAVLAAVVVLWMSEAIPMAMTPFLGVPIGFMRKEVGVGE